MKAGDSAQPTGDFVDEFGEPNRTQISSYLAFFLLPIALSDDGSNENIVAGSTSVLSVAWFTDRRKSLASSPIRERRRYRCPRLP